MANEATGRYQEVPTGYNKDVTNEIVSARTKRFLAWPLNSTLATDKCHGPAVRAIVWVMEDESIHVIGRRTAVGG